MVSSDNSVKNGTQFSVSFWKKVTLIKNQQNNWDLDMINLFLLSMLLLAGWFTAGGNPAMD